MSTDARQLEDRDDLKRRLIAALERRTTRRRHGDDPVKVPAITIARWLRIKPQAKHETRRRRVRELIDDLRADGCTIASDFTGYWLALKPADHQAFQAFMKRMGLRNLVSAAQDRRAPLTEEQAGQLQLFGD